MTYGEAARKARMKAGYTQDQLELIAGVPRNTISRIEKDKFLPRLDTMLAILRVLDIGIDKYLGIEPKHLRWESIGDNFGVNAARCRMHHGLSLVQLSERSGRAMSTITCFETNRSTPTVGTVLSLAQAVGVSPDEYLGLPSPYERWHR